MLVSLRLPKAVAASIDADPADLSGKRGSQRLRTDNMADASPLLDRPGLVHDRRLLDIVDVADDEHLLEMTAVGERTQGFQQLAPPFAVERAKHLVEHQETRRP